jgi:hypothetical protein
MTSMPRPPTYECTILRPPPALGRIDQSGGDGGPLARLHGQQSACGRDGITRADEYDDVGGRSRISQQTRGFLGIPPTRMDVERLHGHEHFRLLRIVGEER